MLNLLRKPIHILSIGGTGTAIGWALAREGYSVILIDNNTAKVSKGKKKGVTVVGLGAQAASFMSFDDWIAPTEGLILLCTKTYDNPEVLARLPDDAFLVSIQNGFDPKLEQRDQPATRITRPGSLHIGARRSITADEQTEIMSLAIALGKAKLFPVKLVPDVRPYKATKLMYNAAISPLAAMAGLDNGELLTDQLAKSFFFCIAP